MAMPAKLLRPVPLKQVVRGATDARGGGKRRQTVMAALLLIVDRPAQADDGDEHCGKRLQQLGSERQHRVQRQLTLDILGVFEMCRRCCGHAYSLFLILEYRTPRIAKCSDLSILQCC